MMSGDQNHVAKLLYLWHTLILPIFKLWSLSSNWWNKLKRSLLAFQQEANPWRFLFQTWPSKAESDNESQNTASRWQHKDLPGVLCLFCVVGGSPEDRKQNPEITLKYGLPRDQFKGEEIFKLDNKSKQILLVDVFYHFWREMKMSNHQMVYNNNSHQAGLLYFQSV